MGNKAVVGVVGGLNAVVSSILFDCVSLFVVALISTTDRITTILRSIRGLNP